MGAITRLPPFEKVPINELFERDMSSLTRTMNFDADFKLLA
jgi:hypothetical protein